MVKTERLNTHSCFTKAEGTVRASCHNLKLSGGLDGDLALGSEALFKGLRPLQHTTHLFTHPRYGAAQVCHAGLDAGHMEMNRQTPPMGFSGPLVSAPSPG